MARLNNNNEQDAFVLRDYNHAAKTFTSEPGYEKTPYAGFLFHVNISFNNVTGASSIDTKNISVLIKSADLPEIQFETETLNQYNRKRIINKRVVYQPIQLVFHDDVANNVRNMWIAYNQYYSADSNYTDVNTWQLDNVYQTDSLVRNYGLDTGISVPFINKIEIYSMGNHQYSKMLLVNPVINNAKFDDHDYKDGAKVMQTALTVEYENIIYSTGTTDNIPGFGADNVENYDQTVSSLGATAPFETFGSANTATSRTNTPIAQQVLSSQELLARQIDPIAGNVKRNLVSLTQNQFKQVKDTAVNINTLTQNQFQFPDTSIVNLDAVTVSSGISSFESFVGRSNQVSSNGRNVAALSDSTVTVSTTPVPLADTNSNTEIVITPVVPGGLTAAERTLFNASYPPLPSTDPRTKQAPYV